MTKLHFKTLKFTLKEEQEEGKIKQQYLVVYLLNIFYCKIPLSELSGVKIIDEHSIEVNEKKFNLLLMKYFDQLTNSINQNPAVYVHRNSGIPLLGSVQFGIVYRNTSLIEIKPVTSCNLNCIYCSVGEGKGSKKIDFVVEKDYLIEELEKLLDFVGEPVEIHIGVQGEPFLYADIVPLIADLQNNEQITIISMDTNMTLTSKHILNKLSDFDKLRLNISIDAMNKELAEKLAGCAYNLEHVLEMTKYAKEKGIKILIAPVLVPGYNEEEMEKIVRFVKKLGIKAEQKHPLLGIQNFLNYKTGRNPTKAWSWEKYREFIKGIESKEKVKLLLSETDFGIRKTKKLEKPFKVDDVISATIKSFDRFPKSVIAVAKDRTISVPDCQFKKEKKIKVKITRDKHNIFNGKLV